MACVSFCSEVEAPCLLPGQHTAWEVCCLLFPGKIKIHTHTHKMSHTHTRCLFGSPAPPHMPKSWQVLGEATSSHRGVHGAGRWESSSPEGGKLQGNIHSHFCPTGQPPRKEGLSFHAKQSPFLCSPPSRAPLQSKNLIFSFADMLDICHTLLIHMEKNRNM